MCQHYQEQQQRRQNPESSATNNLYPNLSDFFNIPRTDGLSGSNEANFASFLQGLLMGGDNNVDVNRNSATTEEEDQRNADNPQPSAPPPPPSPEPRRRPCPCHYQGSYRARYNQGRNECQEFFNLFAERAMRFFAVFKSGLKFIFGMIMLNVLFSLIPGFILQTALFMIVAKGLRLHLPTIFASFVLYNLIRCSSTFILLGFGLCALHKVCVLKKPLVDLNYWMRKLDGRSCHCSSNY